MGSALAREDICAVSGRDRAAATAALLASTGSYWAVAVYMIVLSLITLVSVYLGPETYRRGMTREEVREEDGQAGARTVSWIRLEAENL